MKSPLISGEYDDVVRVLLKDPDVNVRLNTLHNHPEYLRDEMMNDKDESIRSLAIHRNQRHCGRGRFPAHTILLSDGLLNPRLRDLDDTVSEFEPVGAVISLDTPNTHTTGLSLPPGATATVLPDNRVVICTGDDVPPLTEHKFSQPMCRVVPTQDMDVSNKVVVNMGDDENE